MCILPKTSVDLPQPQNGMRLAWPHYCYHAPAPFEESFQGDLKDEVKGIRRLL